MKYIKSFIDLIFGFVIIMSFYFFSLLIVKTFHIMFPPPILGLIIFSLCLIFGIVKEKWVKTVCDFLINNMGLFLVPFWGGLIVYKSLLMKNWLVIFTVIFVTTILIIVFTGLFVEWGIKLIRLYKIRNKND